MELDFDRETLEKLLLKQILTDKNYINGISTIFDKRWIETENLGMIIGLCLKYFNKYGKIPSVEVVKLLAKKMVESGKCETPLADIYNLIDSALNNKMDIDSEVLTKNISEFIRKRALWCSIMDNVEDLEKNSEEVLEKCLTRFDNVSKITFNDKDLGLNYFSDDGMKSHWEYINNPEAKISTGWEGIDKYTNGGFLKDGRSLYIFMGQAGLGKSLFLSNLTVNLLKQNMSVVVISLEMSQDVYAQRFDAHISRHNINRLKDTSEKTIDKIKKFYEEHPESDLFIKEYPPRSIRTSDIELYLENLKLAGKKFDAIVVDYLNLVLPQKSSDNMYQGALEVSEKLRALSYKFKVPVITATQCNSEGMNNENIGMENISESRGIAHTCDFLLGLYQMTDDRENGIINGRILKNRLGGMVGKVVHFKMDSENLTLSDISMDSVSNAEISETGKILNNIPDMSDDIDDMGF